MRQTIGGCAMGPDGCSPRYLPLNQWRLGRPQRVGSVSSPMQEAALRALRCRHRQQTATLLT